MTQPATVFDPPSPTFAPVEGGGLFPVRRIYCVGRNYADHVKEMGGRPEEQPPIFFMKPAEAAWTADEVPYPPATGDLHHEIELVAALGRGGADVDAAEALSLVYGYAAGVDLTRRDLQSVAKDRGQPWDSAKGFDASAPLGPIRPVLAGGLPEGRLWLSVNGERRQDAPLASMIWSVAEIISALSKLWRLEAGDLIFTGTPNGVGPLNRGDQVEGGVGGVGSIAFRIV
jgi:fumarylpyruvate hydrolase